MVWYLDIVSEPSNQAATLVFSHVIRRIHDVGYRSGVESFLILGENVATMVNGVFFTHFHPFYEPFNDQILWLESGGFLERQRKWTNRIALAKDEGIGPQVLTLDHLGIAFVACTIPLIASIVAFFLELIGPRIWEAIRRLVGLIVLLRYVRTIQF